MSIYRRVLRYYRPFLGQTILGLFLSLIGIGLNLLKQWPFQVIVDDFLRAGQPIRSDWRMWIPLLCVGVAARQVHWGIANWKPSYFFPEIGFNGRVKVGARS